MLYRVQLAWTGLRNKDSYDKLIINMISICNTNNIKENNENYTEVHVKYENVIKQYNLGRMVVGFTTIYEINAYHL
jgi:hypothetical protein